MFDFQNHPLNRYARVVERNSRRGSLRLGMTLLQKLSVRDAQTKLLCTCRMHPRCVRPTTGTILFNLIQRKRKKDDLLRMLFELDTHNKGE